MPRTEAKGRYWPVLGALRAYAVAVRLSFRSFTYYWLDYLVGLVGYALAEGSSMAFIVAALFAFHAVDGWTFRPLVVLLGLSTLVRSIRTTFTASVVTIPELIQAGSFDTFLVRPVHPVLQAMNQPGSYPLGPAGIIAIPIAMFAFRYAGVKLSIQSLVLIVGTVVGGVLMLLVVDIAIASLSLWTAQSVEQGQMNRTMQYIQGAYSQYPLAVSPRWSGGR